MHPSKNLIPVSVISVPFISHHQTENVNINYWTLKGCERYFQTYFIYLRINEYFILLPLHFLWLLEMKMKLEHNVLIKQNFYLFIIIYSSNFEMIL